MKRIIIQLWQTTVDDPQLAATPFFFACAAAAMDMHVEIHATGQSVELFVQNDPRRHQPVAPTNRPLSEFIEDALRTGVKIHACSTAMRDRHLEITDLIDGFGEVIGMVTMIERATQDHTTVMTF